MEKKNHLHFRQPNLRWREGLGGDNRLIRSLIVFVRDKKNARLFFQVNGLCRSDRWLWLHSRSHIEKGHKVLCFLKSFDTSVQVAPAVPEDRAEQRQTSAPRSQRSVWVHLKKRLHLLSEASQLIPVALQLPAAHWRLSLWSYNHLHHSCLLRIKERRRSVRKH